MKKVIVTGGSGFIGSNLIKFLIKNNYFVINIDKNTYSKNSYILKNINKKKYIFHKLDINNKKEVLKILKKINRVLFLTLLQKRMLIDL